MNLEHNAVADINQENFKVKLNIFLQDHVQYSPVYCYDAHEDGSIPTGYFFLTQFNEMLH